MCEMNKKTRTGIGKEGSITHTLQRGSGVQRFHALPLCTQLEGSRAGTKTIRASRDPSDLFLVPYASQQLRSLAVALSYKIKKSKRGEKKSRHTRERNQRDRNRDMRKVVTEIG